MMPPMTYSHRERALEYLANAQDAAARLDQLHQIPAETRPAHRVAQAHEDKRNAIAFARLEAALEVGEQLAILNGTLALSTRPLGPLSARVAL